MVETRIDSDENRIVITFLGFLDVSQMGVVKQELQNAHITKEHVLLSVKDVDNIDLSFLQLVHAFLLKLKKNGKEFTFQWNVEEEYFRLVEESGFIADFNKISNL